MDCVKALGIVLLKMGVVFCNTIPIFNNLNREALTRPKAREFMQLDTSFNSFFLFRSQRKEEPAC